MAIAKVVKARRDEKAKELKEKIAAIQELVGKTLDPHTGLPLYKVLNEQGDAVHRSGGNNPFRWKLPTQEPSGKWIPGEWMEVALPLVWCRHGFHVTPSPVHWTTGGKEVVWCVEWKGELVACPKTEEDLVVSPTSDRDKVAVEKVRLTRPATSEEIQTANEAYAKWCEAEEERTRPDREEWEKGRAAREEERQRKYREEQEARELARKKEEAEELVERLKAGAEAARKSAEQRKKAGLPSTGYQGIVQAIALLDPKLSERDLGYGCRDAADFALKHLKFDLDDFEKLSKLTARKVGERRTVWPSLWMDDWIYRTAIGHGNKSAMMAYEHWMKVKPFISPCVSQRYSHKKESGRLYDRISFDHGGERYMVTSVRFDEGYVNAKKRDVWVDDPARPGASKEVPNPDQKVYRITRAELLGETKAVNAKEKASKQLREEQRRKRRGY